MKIMTRLIAAALLGIFSTGALAQSGCPTIVTGAVLTAAQWNACFATKQNTIPYTPVNKAGDTMLGRLTMTPSTTAAAGINIAPGVAPTSPNNGDMWTTTAGLFVRINGSTVGPLGGSSFANPTASVGLSAVNGVATTAMRSDAAPALSQTITPTWTGLHTFGNTTLAAQFNGGGIAINPTALSVKKGFAVTQTSPTSGTAVGPLAFNNIAVNNQYGTTNGGGSDPFDLAYATAHSVILTEGGSNVTGFQIAQLTRLNHTVGTSNISAVTSADHIGHAIQAYSNQNAGTAGLYALSSAVWMASGAVHRHVVGANPEIIVKTGSSMVVRAGVRSQSMGDVGAQATTSDAAYTIAAGTTPFRDGFVFSEPDFDAQSILATGSMFRTHQAMTVASVFNMSNLTVTGDIALFPHVKLTGAGVLTLNPNSVAIGSVPTPTTGTVLQLVQADATIGLLELDTFGSGAAVVPVFRGMRSRGTAASRTAVQSGDALASFSGAGYDGSALTGALAGMSAFAEENFSGSAQGSNVTFFTTPTGAIAAATRGRFNAAGVLTVSQNATAIGSLPTPEAGVLFNAVGPTSTNSTVQIETFGSTGVESPTFRGVRSRGTAASRSAVQLDDTLGVFGGAGYDSAAYSSVQAGIAAFASQTWTGSAHGAYLSLFSTADGATSATTRGAVEKDGGLTWPRAVTGGTKGAGTINATALYQAGTQVVAGSLGATDNVAVRADGTGGFTTQGSALVIADTTGALSRSGAGGVPVQGSNTNLTVAVGDVGQKIACTPVAIGTPVSLTNNTPANLCQMDLTAGNWLVFCNPIFADTTTTSVAYVAGSISTASATLQTGVGQFTSYTFASAGVVNNLLNNIGMQVGAYPASLNGTTTHYCVAQSGFSVSTMGVYGGMYAIRLP